MHDCRPFEVSLDNGLRVVTVHRHLMREMYGAPVNKLAVTSDTDERFLFHKLEVNPHLPQELGMPGLLLTASPDQEWKDGRQKVFVGLRTKKYWYVGDYELAKTKAIPVEEYRAWPARVSVFPSCLYMYNVYLLR